MIDKTIKIFLTASEVLLLLLIIVKQLSADCSVGDGACPPWKCKAALFPPVLGGQRASSRMNWFHLGRRRVHGKRVGLGPFSVPLPTRTGFVSKTPVSPGSEMGNTAAWLRGAGCAGRALLRGCSPRTHPAAATAASAAAGRLPRPCRAWGPLASAPAAPFNAFLGHGLNNLKASNNLKFSNKETRCVLLLLQLYLFKTFFFCNAHKCFVLLCWFFFNKRVC